MCKQINYINNSQSGLLFKTLHLIRLGSLQNLIR
uniref:Uncharacterized protein n=1 Tax=Rhizophora mucronata TaxID=61149 RepID=A0A2P2J3N7_RHIMU